MLVPFLSGAFVKHACKAVSEQNETAQHFLHTALGGLALIRSADCTER